MTQGRYRAILAAATALVAWLVSLSTASAHFGADHAGGLAHLEGIGLVAVIVIIGIAYWLANRGGRSTSHFHGDERSDDITVQSPLVKKDTVLQRHLDTREAPR